ncbi:MAG: class I SAM-dependent methyltransferase [Candidatus Beckwithbacteria bacterium]|nr:class I SAM-dependent methyltransferase [Candidatus Beckwithbacteria bacterium]
MKFKKTALSGYYTDQYFKSRVNKQKTLRQADPAIFQKVAQFINLTGPVGDIGSGAGNFLKACETRGIKAIGIEGCKAAVLWANKNSNNKTIRHDLTKKLPFKDNFFQLVQSNSVVEHLKPAAADQVIAEAYRILRPQGLFVCSCPNYFDWAERFPEHINLYTPTRLRQALKKHKFQIVYEHFSFNLSLLTPWERFKENVPTGKWRLMTKKNSRLINLILAPIWLPVRLINKYILNWETLDIVAGECYFIGRKN